ncbi:hypothetical protein PR048_030824 [Dryococelus australis]|uniref:Uncharacterized protein n=1 Tax=Dryococelus australis TaxID=614101 RepID=A0ABQ9GAQ7_9NEOP|nr:hypothetical protein PR048_030824 [Dryococelus australis]
MSVEKRRNARGGGKLEIAEKTRRPAALPGHGSNPGGGGIPAGNRTRFALTGGEWSLAEVKVTHIRYGSRVTSQHGGRSVSALDPQPLVPDSSNARFTIVFRNSIRDRI